MTIHQFKFPIQMFRRIKISFYLIVVFLCLQTENIEAGQTWESLNRPPVDSVDAANVRIWLPVSHAHPCLVNIIIYDTSGNKVRLLLSKPLRKNFYNFYWDKRNDSGYFVPAGEYSYIADDCGKKRTGKISASYKKWELLSKLLPQGTDNPFSVGIELLRDSALVSIEVMGRLGNIVATPISDSLLAAGKHYLLWKKESSKEIRRGKFRLAITIGDFTYYQKVRVK